MKSASKPKPKMSTDIEAYKAAKAKWQEEQAGLAEAQKRLEYWKEVKAESERMQGMQNAPASTAEEKKEQEDNRNGQGNERQDSGTSAERLEESDSTGARQNDSGSSEILPEEQSADTAGATVGSTGQTSESSGTAEGSAEGVAENEAVSGESVAQEQDNFIPYEEQMKLRIEQWEKALGVKVVVYTDYSQVKSRTVRAEWAKGEQTPGWYDTGTNTAYIFLPHNNGVKSIDETFVHEAVSHKGIKEMLGEEAFNKFLDGVWNMMSEKARKEYLGYVRGSADNTENRRAAADEYVAHLSEGMSGKLGKGLSSSEKGVWNKIVDFFRDLFASENQDLADAILDKKVLTDNDIKQMIAQSFTSLRDKAQGSTEATTQSTDELSRPIQETNDTDDLLEYAQRDAERREMLKKVYHGSGAEFDKFDHGHMGEGEGAQAFGWGTYVTDVKDIGRTYAIATAKPLLTYKGETVDTESFNSPWRIIKDLYDENNGRLRDMRARAERIASLVEEDNAEMKGLWGEVNNLLKNVRSGDLKIAQSRNLYEVEIPDDNGSNYIVYDKDVSKKVKDDVKRSLFNVLVEEDYKGAEKELKRELDDLFALDMDGGQLYGNVSAYLGSDKQASEFLNGMGFVGIKYPAGSLSGVKSDASNYVIFNENDLQIQERTKFRKTSTNEVVEELEAKGIVAENEEEGQIMFSKRTYEESGRDSLKDFVGKQVGKGALTQEQADEIVAQMEEIYEVCSKYEGVNAPFRAWSNAEVEVGKDGVPVFSVIKQNGDYGMNLDFSLVCKKRRTLDAVLGELINRGLIDKFMYDGVQIAQINDIIRKHGFETACRLCFVDSKRFRVFAVADKFVSMYNSLVGMTDKQLQKIVDTTKKETVRKKAARHLLENPEDRIKVGRENFVNSDGFEDVAIDRPEILKLYNMSKGSGGPKASFGDVQYLNDIQNTTWTPEKAYSVGGVRLQSFSDYVPRMVLDYVQMLADLASKRLPVHAYTKEPIFAKQFGLSGIKINLSLVPRVDADGVAPGLDKDGNYAWQEGETFPYEEAVALQNAEGYKENCGTIAVGVSDEHIEKLLNDENIRMVIPYHKSGLNKQVAIKNNIDKFKDYTNEQNTRKGGSKVGKEGLNGMPDFNALVHEGMHPREAAQAYLDWCDSKGYTPKFDKFRENPNYYKLLEDFTTVITENGAETLAPQRSVEMRFPSETDAFGSMETLIKEGLEEDAVLEGKRQSEVGNIVDEIVETLGEVRFRKANRNQIGFVSNAMVAVEGVKQEKATPEQWLKMIEKQGGLKAGEDKWLGLSDWLKSSDKKTLTKDEVLEFIGENMIQIEEVRYEDFGKGVPADYDYKLSQDMREYAQGVVADSKAYYESEGYDAEDVLEEVARSLKENLDTKYGDGASEFFAVNDNLQLEETGEVEDFREFANKVWRQSYGKAIDSVYPINPTRSMYQTRGLTNNREIALVVPSVEEYHGHMPEVHFDDKATKGKAVAWIRFGETTDADGSKVLVIDEIQSQRHQDGREKGYANEKTISEIKQQIDVLLAEQEQIANDILREQGLGASDKNKYDALAGRIGTQEQKARQKEIDAELYNLNHSLRNKESGVPDAPFEKNWHELAMKRMLRFAAEEGFDKVAWTTGAQQAKRYNLSRVDGMEGFYDKMLPSFVQKYTKKWGAKVGEVTLPNLGKSAQKMWSVDVTPQMKESVEEQVMFRFIGKKGAENLDKAEEASTRLDNLNVAREMEDAGKDAKAIKLATGWERGADGLWRYETEDFKIKSDAPLMDIENSKLATLSEIVGGKLHLPNGEYATTLGELLDDEELFKAYPHLKGTSVVIKNMGADVLGEYDAVHNEITLDRYDVGISGNGAYGGSTLAHEIQHAIQDIEGFGTGGSAIGLNARLSKEFDGVVAEVKRLRSEGKNAEADELVKANRGLTEAVINNDNDAYGNYKKLAGEVEARNVQNRMDMPIAERRASLASETEDVAREDQIILKQGLGLNYVQDMNDTNDLVEYAKRDARRREELRVMGIVGRYAKSRWCAPVTVLVEEEDAKEKLSALGASSELIDNAVDIIKGDILAGGYNKGLKRIFIFARNSEEEIVTTLKHENTHAVLDLLSEDDFNALYDALKSAYPKTDANIRKMYLEEFPDYTERQLQEELVTLTLEYRTIDSVRDKLSDNGLDVFNNVVEIVGYEQKEDDSSRRGRTDSRAGEGSGSTVGGTAEEANREAEGVNENSGSESKGQPIDLVAYAQQKVKEREDEVKFRRMRPIKIIKDREDKEQEAYNSSLQGFLANLLEAHVDYLRSVRKLQEAIENALGRKIPSYANPYLLALQCSSKNKIEQELLSINLVEPMKEFLRKLVFQKGINYEQINDYLNAKHGLERNVKLADRDAREIATDDKGNLDMAAYQNELQKNRKKDYSGLTDIFRTEEEKEKQKKVDVKELERRAQAYIDEFEKKIGSENVKNLWSHVKQLTNYALEKSFSSNLISKEEYDDMMNTYQYYVPLRGFAEKTAGDVWNYLSDNSYGIVNPVKKTAHGRESKADDILSTIQNMAESSIVQGNRNQVNLALLNLAEDTDTSLLSVRKMWYVKDYTTDEWVISTPKLREGMTSEELNDAIQKHEEDMRKLQEVGRAKQKKGKMKIQYRIEDYNVAEHGVRVKRGGTEYIVYVNGNPKAAQALNGLLNLDAWAESNKYLDKSRKFYKWLFRVMAKTYTSLSPEFIIKNFMRDIQSATTVMSVRHDKDFVKDMLKHVGENVPLTSVFGKDNKGKKAKVKGIYALYGKFYGNTLDSNNPRERYFQEFMMNGGETGYTQLNSVEDIKKQMAEIEENVLKHGVKGMWEFITDKVESANRGIENAVRFAAYQTAREKGMPIVEAINEAKEASVNFNRKGSGAMGNATARNLYLFYNPAVQSTYQYAKLVKDYGWKGAAAFGVWAGLGAIIPTINMCVYAMFAGGDDDDEVSFEDFYMALTPYKRRNFINFYVGGGDFISIMLPNEARVPFGLASIATEVALGKLSVEQAAWDATGQVLNNILPRDIYNDNLGNARYSEGMTDLIEGVAKGLIPDIPASIMGPVVFNEDFLGRPITGVNKYNEHLPEWQRLGKNTPKWVHDMAYKVANLDGDPYAKEKYDSKYTNPGAWVEVVSNYLPFIPIIKKGVRTYEAYKRNDEVDEKMRNMPFVSQFMTTVNEDYAKNLSMRNEFEQFMSDVDDVQDRRRSISVDKSLGVVEEAQLRTALDKTPEGIVYNEWTWTPKGGRSWKNIYNDIMDEYKEARDNGDVEERKEKMKELDNLRKSVIKVFKESLKNNGYLD